MGHQVRSTRFCSGLRNYLCDYLVELNANKATASMPDRSKCYNGSGIAGLHLHLHLHINMAMFASCLFLRILARFSFGSTIISAQSFPSTLKTITRSFPHYPLLCHLSASVLTSGTMRFLQLLPIASLSLAIPNPNSRTKRQTSCTSEPWAIQQYHSTYFRRQYFPLLDPILSLETCLQSSSLLKGVHKVPHS